MWSTSSSSARGRGEAQGHAGVILSKILVQTNARCCLLLAVLIGSLGVVGAQPTTPKIVQS